MVDTCNRSTWNAEAAGTWVPYKTWAVYKARLCLKEVKENKKHWQCMEKQGGGERGSCMVSCDRGAQSRDSDSWGEMEFMGRKLEGACEGGPSGVGTALVLGCSNLRLPKTGQKSA